MKWRDRECFVSCDGEPLDEYCVATDGEREMTCWIASEVGKRFTISINHTNTHQDFLVELWLDGHNVEGCMFQSTDIIRSAEFEGALAGGDCIRPYVFSSVAVTDDETLAHDTSNLGDIRVSWFRVRNPQCILPFEPLDEDEEEQYENGLGGEDVVMHEREKKGGHRIVLGEPEKDAGSDIWNFDRVDPAEAPFFTFTWRYRPREILQAQGIIPSPKRPLSLSASNPNHRVGKRRRVHVIHLDADSRASSAMPDAGMDVGVEVEGVDLEELESLEAQRDALEEQIRLARIRAISRARSRSLARSHSAQLQVRRTGSGMVERAGMVERDKMVQGDRMVKREVPPIMLRGERVVIDLTGGDD
ncbi:hypothetical protein BC629DRAFT_1472187 [Irpex lacteus]|nr:hypothetical protein BC629DRAFT_1472187 [Irpex lacteus]